MQMLPQHLTDQPLRASVDTSSQCILLPSLRHLILRSAIGHASLHGRFTLPTRSIQSLIINIAAAKGLILTVLFRLLRLHHIPRLHRRGCEKWKYS